MKTTLCGTAEGSRERLRGFTMELFLRACQRANKGAFMGECEAKMQPEKGGFDAVGQLRPGLPGKMTALIWGGRERGLRGAG